jgi:hypothetical protein
MELTEDSETSANHNLTPGKYPKEHVQYSKHGERLKSRIIRIVFFLVLCSLYGINNNMATVYLVTGVFFVFDVI